VSGTGKASRRKTRVVRGAGRPVESEGSVGAEAIVAATIKLLIEATPSRLTRAQVAKAVGVDPRLIWYYFTDLEGLFLAATDTLLLELRSRLERVSAIRGSFRERLRARVRTYLVFFRENPNFHSLVYEHVLNGKTAEGARLRKRMLEPSMRELDELVREGISSGEVRVVDPRFVHTATIAMTEFFFSGRAVFDELFPGADRSSASMEEHYCDFVTEIIMGTSARGGLARPSKPAARARRPAAATRVRPS
jgi:AcrR family transcriptional regulator